MLTITDTMASHTRLARPFLAVDQHGSLNGKGELDAGDARSLASLLLLWLSLPATRV